ncbi:P78/83 [Buzura suppressaria nucleopolyhedrovirus]|uniref:p78/83 n=1 Tax=Buzura suppressaria nuclear polyhedrosis virus TaxID=74320 RepID=W5VKG7_NPVBS|nr:P78/83 [Buzura suppressaria nucleopolyhedrovirus]AHH82651.1 P78/83 [Buzura suppressaria nucleopolyhedrovirus]AKN91034.1 P78/83 [Buzura suppressaria nucleopolyhedrovirus]QYF10623.1 ac78-like [Buzura suppressaria nucleopolyhedrovirus]
MNLDVPYERLGVKNTVEYIPLKLALNDVDNDNKNTASNEKRLLFDYNNGDTVQLNPICQNSSDHVANVLLVTLLTIFCIIVLLYAIYYFVLIRDRRHTIARQRNFL